MPSSRAILRDIDSLGLNPAKAHSLIKASGRLGVRHVDVEVDEKHDKGSKHSKDKGSVEKETFEVKKTETKVEKDEDVEVVTTVVETKKLEIKTEEKPEKTDRLEKEVDKKDLVTSEKIDDKDSLEEESKDKRHDSKKKKLANRANLLKDLLLHLTNPHA